ncbi:MAG: hypothetical protein VR73_04770 [Gammaproteobacteria bacterium BRH_c0]|nr:MAG: hypothetical protein VR73_04770 [Gammaproteobacteria bacterium BRH_c0]
MRREISATIKKAPHAGLFSDQSDASGADDIHILAIVGAAYSKLYAPFNSGKQGVIATNPYVDTGVNTGATLADDDIASLYNFAAKALDAKAFTF